jgi:hypothetical protein
VFVLFRRGAWIGIVPTIRAPLVKLLDDLIVTDDVVMSNWPDVRGDLTFARRTTIQGMPIARGRRNRLNTDDPVGSMHAFPAGAGGRHVQTRWRRS